VGLAKDSRVEECVDRVLCSVDARGVCAVPSATRHQRRTVDFVSEPSVGTGVGSVHRPDLDVVPGQASAQDGVAGVVERVIDHGTPTEFAVVAGKETPDADRPVLRVGETIEGPVGWRSQPIAKP
jgi:hypothetical protein